ncbi:hypothetical protein GH714_036786 [Hevea brasiliensis]|uniref:Uncharacterized protein n=1 Tax=Hevea brasiliensis TaxID=3981 RepID=A0A6A6KDM5_HEVBR|nr:hypothetical protein GH714_036786 [Hevea brasiliensis]
MDAPTSVSTETSAMNGNSSEVDLFADATFVSAPPQVEKGASTQSQTQVDLFASQSVIPPAVPPAVDLFSSADPVVQPETKDQKSDSTNNNIVDPFAAVPLNNFDGSDLFGAFSSRSNSASTEPAKDPINGGGLNDLNVNASDSKPTPKKETFQVKSGIWSDSLSRGLIDLNISARNPPEHLAAVKQTASVSEYIEDLIARVTHVPNPSNQPYLGFFLNGLLEQIRVLLFSHEVTDLARAMASTIEVERELQVTHPRLFTGSPDLGRKINSHRVGSRASFPWSKTHSTPSTSVLSSGSSSTKPNSNSPQTWSTVASASFTKPQNTALTSRTRSTRQYSHQETKT